MKHGAATAHASMVLNQRRGTTAPQDVAAYGINAFLDMVDPREVAAVVGDNLDEFVRTELVAKIVDALRPEVFVG